tara:strand:+ start:544 stop:831 length:288 start_codon:yes stop_codon:yes gene_type:complete
MKLRHLEDMANDIMDIQNPDTQWESIFETLHGMESYKLKAKGWKSLFKRLWGKKEFYKKQLNMTREDLEAKVRRLHIYMDRVKKLENELKQNKKK